MSLGSTIIAVHARPSLGPSRESKARRGWLKCLWFCRQPVHVALSRSCWPFIRCTLMPHKFGDYQLRMAKNQLHCNWDQHVNAKWYWACHSGSVSGKVIYSRSPFQNMVAIKPALDGTFAKAGNSHTIVESSLPKVTVNHSMLTTTQAGLQMGTLNWMKGFMKAMQASWAQCIAQLPSSIQNHDNVYCAPCT